MYYENAGSLDMLSSGIQNAHIPQPVSLNEATEQFWQNLFSHHVLFHPVGDMGFDSVKRANHLADVFVICDWKWPYTPKAFDWAVRQFLIEDETLDRTANFTQYVQEQNCDLPVEKVRTITGASADFGLFDEPAWKAGREPWCRIARLNVYRGAEGRSIWLLYIVGNSIEIYQRLFLERGFAPDLLWLDCPLNVDVNAWLYLTIALFHQTTVFRDKPP